MSSRGSKRALRAVRERLLGIRADDMFVADMIRMCIDICDEALQPGKLPPHQAHSETSVEAALAIAPKFGEKVNSVLIFLSQQDGGMTDQEAQVALSMSGDSYRPCRVTLADKGYVWDTGERRKTAHNRRAMVWAITERGREHLKRNEA